jgi:hypothetical protein
MEDIMMKFILGTLVMVLSLGMATCDDVMIIPGFDASSTSTDGTVPDGSSTPDGSLADDAGADAADDSGAPDDGGPDDAGTADAEVDAGLDSGSDASNSSDGSHDASSDAGADSGHDAGFDGGLNDGGISDGGAADGGTLTCVEMLVCVFACGQDYTCWGTCYKGATQEAKQALLALATCIYTNCKTDCGAVLDGGGGVCQTCILTNCGTEWTDCQNN